MFTKPSLPRRAVMACAASLLAIPRARAQAPVVRIGVLTDLSGPYRDNGGLTAVACAQQAVQDLGLAARGINVEIISGDHQNKPDVGLSVARQWFDRGDVDAVAEVNNSAIAMAITDLCTERNKVFLCSGAGSVDLTGSRCSPNLTQWQNDTWMDARIGEAVLNVGGDKWFFIVADYATGHLLRRDAAKAVEAGGGKVMGEAVYPFPSTSDFSSFLLQAQASGANVIAFCNAGDDLVNCIKQSHEFGMAGTKLVGIVTFLNNIRALGLSTAQGLLLTESFYWDRDERTRAFMNRIKSKVPENWPNSEHAAAYGAALHYLKAVSALGVPRAKASGVDVVRTMKGMPTDDDCFGAGSVRVDGRHMHPMYLYQVKQPTESNGPWDLYKLMNVIPIDRAVRPMAEGGCNLTDKFKPNAA